MILALKKDSADYPYILVDTDAQVTSGGWKRTLEAAITAVIREAANPSQNNGYGSWGVLRNADLTDNEKVAHLSERYEVLWRTDKQDTYDKIIKENPEWFI